MPYTKKGKKRPYKKGKKALATKAFVKKALRKEIEMKKLFYIGTGSAVGRDVTNSAASDFTSISYGSTAVVSGLCASILTGTGAAARTGLKVRLKGINISFAVQPGDNTNVVRFLLISPKAKRITMSSTAAFLQQVLCNTASGGAQVWAPVDTDMFKIHWDKRFWLRYMPLDGSSATTVAQTRFFRRFVKFNREVNWDESNSGLPTNDVFLVALSDSAIAANPGTTLMTATVYFTDA